MPYDLFWYGPIEAFDNYQQKYIVENKELAILTDMQAWTFGAYVMDAFRSVLSGIRLFSRRSIKYPDRPRTQEEVPQEEKNARTFNFLKKRFGHKKRRDSDGGGTH